MTSVLAPLPLTNVGTHSVESLASFFRRLAWTHVVTTTQMFNFVTTYPSVSGTKSKRRIASGDPYPAMFCSYSSQSLLLVQQLERLTGQTDLVCGTLLRLSGNLCRNQSGALLPIRRWCPLCYSENEDEAPEPLAWMLPSVTRCPIHDKRLLCVCPNCGARPKYRVLNRLHRKCVICGMSLTTEGRDVPPTIWESWCQQESLRLIEHMATIDSAAFETNALSLFFGALPKKLGSYVALAKHIRRMRQGFALRPNHHPRLPSLFSIAASCGTTPLEILLRPKEAASTMLFLGDANIPSPPRKLLATAANRWKCVRQFEELLQTPKSVMLLSAAQICARFGVSKCAFKTTNHQLWNRYQLELANRKSDASFAQLHRAVNFVAEIFKCAGDCGERVHLKRTVRRAMNEIEVPKHVVRSAIRIYLHEINVKHRCAESD